MHQMHKLLPGFHVNTQCVDQLGDSLWPLVVN